MAVAAHTGAELRQSLLAPMLLRAWHVRVLRPGCLRLISRLEGGHFYSSTLRRIFQHSHGIRVGAYSYGECFVPGAWPSGVIIGRYVSIARDVRIFLRNHPIDCLSTHPFFFNSALGVISEDSVAHGTFTIEHDAWIGERALFTPGCSRVGLGAIVGAGSVVTKDVEDFSVVAGNPACEIRSRFPSDVQMAVRESCWWMKSIGECTEHLAGFMHPLVENWSRHPLLCRRNGPSAFG